MGQGLRVLVALAEDAGLTPGIHMAAHNSRQLQVQGSEVLALLTSVGTRHIHGVHTHAQAKHFYTLINLKEIYITNPN